MTDEVVMKCLLTADEVARGSAVSAVDGLEAARCREILGDEATGLSDWEVLRIRDSAEGIARVVVQIHDSQRGQR